MVRRTLVIGSAILALLTGCQPTGSPTRVSATPTVSQSSGTPTSAWSPTPEQRSPSPLRAETTVGSEVAAEVEPVEPGGGECGEDYYRNVDGDCVHRPVSGGAEPPSGATARCGDGTYSFSQHRRGTCSHHGGAEIWY
ncbi:DUF3761 domain-containing protein [Micromonospora sp. WMMD735]|uniref:DUF3761 domain-containing protein n=1 Tax=Micromonospora sp. WMMD735 TaxID=3404130 RepID=UPI003B93B905